MMLRVRPRDGSSAAIRKQRPQGSDACGLITAALARLCGRGDGGDEETRQAAGEGALPAAAPSVLNPLQRWPVAHTAPEFVS